MSYPVIAANSQNVGSVRLPSDIQYIVIHYIADNGSTAIDEGNYFKNNIVKTSAHYFVDKTTIIKSVDDLKVAYSIGESKYNDCPFTGGGTMYGIITNRNSISVVLCNSVLNVPAEVQKNAFKLIESLIRKYGINKSNIYRHFDVTGKHCPACLMSVSVWTAFKAGINSTILLTPKDITNRLKEEGIIGQGEYWIERMQKEATVQELCKKIAIYMIQNKEGKSSTKLTTTNDIAYRLLKATIINDSIFWRNKMGKDKKLLVLCRNAADWTL